MMGKIPPQMLQMCCSQLVSGHSGHHWHLFLKDTSQRIATRLSGNKISTEQAKKARQRSVTERIILSYLPPSTGLSARLGRPWMPWQT